MDGTDWHCAPFPESSSDIWQISAVDLAPLLRPTRVSQESQLHSFGARLQGRIASCQTELSDDLVSTIDFVHFN